MRRLQRRSQRLRARFRLRRRFDCSGFANARLAALQRRQLGAERCGLLARSRGFDLALAEGLDLLGQAGRLRSRGAQRAQGGAFRLAGLEARAQRGGLGAQHRHLLLGARAGDGEARRRGRGGRRRRSRRRRLGSKLLCRVPRQHGRKEGRKEGRMASKVAALLMLLWGRFTHPQVRHFVAQRLRRRSRRLRLREHLRHSSLGTARHVTRL